MVDERDVYSDTAIVPSPEANAVNVDEKAYYREKIKRLLKERNAVMVAHYYTDPNSTTGRRNRWLYF
ncbi:hypothetical protein ACNKHP_21605 [Shigella boydii]